MEKKVTLGGVDYKVAPLKALQVAEFLDAIPEQGTPEPRVKVFTRSLRVIAQALKNGDANCVLLGEDEEKTIASINETAAFQEIDPAFGVVLDITGLRASNPGEAPAAGSTSTESSAAS